MSYSKPGVRTLYDPRAARDACGVGFAATLKDPSHDLLRLGLSALERLAHRGAVGGDGCTGDGAGIMTQVPHRLMMRELMRLGGPATAPGTIGVGALFLPRDEAERASAMVEVEAALLAEGIDVFRWRIVPVRLEALGRSARESAPEVLQILAVAPKDEDGASFERRLYQVRRTVERIFSQGGVRDDLHVASFSARTVVYKGLVSAIQLEPFYPDLADPDFETQTVLFHQRFSTNTAPNWARVQPFRRVAHNGEINTLQGNVHWMSARLPGLLDPHTSDSGMLDNAAEYLQLFSGRDLRHVMMMLVPAAHEAIGDLDPEERAFYRYHACLTEPWDGPAALVFSDGSTVGVTLDRNGLRPMRYTIAAEGLVVAGSEAGIFHIPPEHVVRHGKLGPGEMLAVDLDAGRILEPEENRADICAGRPYAEWLAREIVPLERLEIPLDAVPDIPADHLTRMQTAFGYTSEETAAVIRPMLQHGKPPNGAMGDDTPLAVVSSKERPLFHYFKQRFAEVTNPPLDHMRESLVFSLTSRLGGRKDILQETSGHAHLIELRAPLITTAELSAIRHAGRSRPAFRHMTLDAVFLRDEGPDGLLAGIERLCLLADAAVDEGAALIVLSDRAVGPEHVPIPSLMAVGAVHHHLIRGGRRMRASLIAESGDARDVHHVAALLGYGANAVNPYLGLSLVRELAERGRVRDGLSAADAERNYLRALEDGLRKVMARMGISTVDGYIGAQIFEAVGVGEDVIERCFTHTTSAVGGLGFRAFGELMFAWHGRAYPDLTGKPALSGFYQFRRDGELHEFSPDVVEALHAAVAGAVVSSDDDAARETNAYQGYRNFAQRVADQPPSQIRHYLAPSSRRPPVPLEEVEPALEIVRRFSTGSMSLGSLSPEAHETLAIAMNRLGARSGSGEGGEDEQRFGTERNSAIKQVASARFGVTPAYLSSAKEIQIKMAQGSKPGEGGQIPGSKVTDYVAKLRHTTPGVALISPPPHHDIYSIEDLAQLIYDLKQFNQDAEISVKLVAESGVGIIAAGVAKCYADIIQISGHSGGTGSSPLDSIKNAGIPWEIGLSEAQQTLRASGLRERVVLRVDGGLRTGRDVLVAALLGADEFGFGTAAMIAEGCTMMRICHTDNCPVGVATQKASLRSKFSGTPEKVMNYFLLLAQEVREMLAALGYRSLQEVIGRTDLLLGTAESDSPGALDLQALLGEPPDCAGTPRRHLGSPNRLPHEQRLDSEIIRLARPALEGECPSVEMRLAIRNTDRTVGALLFREIAARSGDRGLPPGTVSVTFEGVAGQSFGAFMTPGVSFNLIGQSNDYLGKGMAGGEIVVRSEPSLRAPSHEHVLCGNTLLYGATGGRLFAAGRAGERFAVRNSGATAVVEGVGDHACEYMTMGTVVILGRTGRNFGAGMTGGEAFVLDMDGQFGRRFNPEFIEPTEVLADDETRLYDLIEEFSEKTGSERARDILRDWPIWVRRFMRLAPKTEQREISATEEGSIA